MPQLEQDIYNSGNEMDTKILQAYKNVGHYFEKVSEREISKQEATDNLQVLLHLITILNYPTPVVGWSKLMAPKRCFWKSSISWRVAFSSFGVLFFVSHFML